MIQSVQSGTEKTEKILVPGLVIGSFSGRSGMHLAPKLGVTDRIHDSEFCHRPSVSPWKS